MSATLTINGANLGDVGVYYCVVKDRYRNTTMSNSATLNVSKIPEAFYFEFNAEPGMF